MVNAESIGDGPSVSYRDVLMDVHYNAAFVRECVAAPSRMICVPDTYADAGLARKSAGSMACEESPRANRAEIGLPTPAMSLG